jgi:hypothetical protein
MFRATHVIPLTVCVAVFAPDVGVGFADTFYVATEESDANPGSSERPWLTLRHASQRVKPGDVVKVASGVYRQTAVITGCHGTAGAPIVFEAHGGKVVLDGSVPVTGWQHEGGARYSATVKDRPVYLVWANGRELLGPGFRFGSFDTVKPTASTLQRGQCVVQDGRVFVRLFDDSDPNKADLRISVGHCLLLQNTQYTVWRGIGTAWGLNGYKLESGSTHNVFTDAELHHHAQGILETAAYKDFGPSQHNTFQRLHIHHIGLTKFEHGIYTDGHDTRVLNCRFDHITGAAIHAYPRPLRGVYDGNVMTDPSPTYHPEHFAGDDPPDPKGFYSAFICWGQGQHRVTNNLIVGPFGNGIDVRADDSQFFNNTIVLDRGAAFFVDANNSRVSNNIMQTSGTYISSETVVELDYNAYFGGKGWRIAGKTYGTLAELKKAGQEEHGIEAAPRFADPINRDYHLAPASPLRNVGTKEGAPGTDLQGDARPTGKGFDLGAYEQE